MNQTEFILNLTWMLLCIGAFGTQVWKDCLRPESTNRNARLRRYLSVLIASLALFPVISASDDRIRLADLETAPVQQTAFNRDHAHHPLSVNTLEDPAVGQTLAPFFLVVVLSFFLLVGMGATARSRWFALTTLGRAPPQLA